MAEEHGLGRRHAPDPRDQSYPMRAALPDRVRRRDHYWTYFHKALDQGREGTCVGHAWKHWMLTSPIRQTKPDTDPLAVTIYDEATHVDEWQGNEGDRTFGTSVRAAAKALQARGYLVEYGWAWDADTAADWLATQGPVVIGVDWHDGMTSTDAEGFIRPTGRLVGGHAVCLIGWSERRGAARGMNSWGLGWGQRGRFWLAGEDLERLLRARGEACTALETRRPSGG